MGWNSQKSKNWVGCYIFLYQTADAVDGKHARNTGQSSPLGALVDHCIDAFVGVTSVVGVVCAMVLLSQPISPYYVLGACGFHTGWSTARVSLAEVIHPWMR